MDPILTEIYSTVLGAAPYVIIAYVMIWLILLAFVMITFSGMKKTERQLEALEKELARRARMTS